MKISDYNLDRHAMPIMLLLIMSTSFILVNFMGENGSRKQIIDGDGSGYYAYLPAIIIHHSVDFTPVFEFEKERRSKDYQGHYFHQRNEILTNKYTAGTSLLILPFFLIAFILSLLFGLPADGYNIFFQYAVVFSAMFYVTLGLWFLYRLLRMYEIRPAISLVVTTTIILGTNLFFYTFVAPSMSHAYSFAMVSAWLFCLRRVFLEYESRMVYLSAFLLGLIVLIRPVNLLVVLAIPFVAATPEAFIKTIRSKLNHRDWIPSALLFILAITPQLVINYLQTGNPFTIGYAKEGFYWNKPEVVSFLFSYRKGWFIYTPLMLLLIPAMIFLLKRSRFEFFSFLFFFVVVIYVFSSWWNWFYGNSFGMRPMVDLYAFFALVIGLSLIEIRRKELKLVTGVVLAAAIFLNLFQTWQYERGIIHYDSMNKQAYWYVFLKSGEEYKGVIADDDEYFYGCLSERSFHNSFYKMKDPAPPGWNRPSMVSDPDGSGKKAVLNSEIVYSPTYKYQIPDTLVGMENLYIRFNMNYAEETPNAATGSLFVADISDKDGNLLFYKTFKVKRLPDKLLYNWRDGRIGFKLPKITDEMYGLKLYVWNRDKGSIRIDHMGIAFYTYDR